VVISLIIPLNALCRVAVRNSRRRWPMVEFCTSVSVIELMDVARAFAGSRISFACRFQPGREETDTYQQAEAKGVSERRAMSAVHV